MQHLSREERLDRTGFGEEKLQGDLIAAFQYLEELRRRRERDYLKGPGVTVQGGMALSWWSVSLH